MITNILPYESQRVLLAYDEINAICFTLTAVSYITNVSVGLGANMKYVHSFYVDFFKITFGMSVVIRSSGWSACRVLLS